MKNREFLFVVFFQAVLWTAIAVFAESPMASASDPVNYRLKWLFNTSVVGDLYALEQGFFRNEGLEVTVKAGGPERDAIREIELGHAQFGVASGDQVIRAYAKGAPVIVILQLFQINPLQWIYRANKQPINTINDLKGKTIGVTYGGNDETIMRTLLAKGGITEKEMSFFSVRYDYTPFYQNKVDIWPVYRNAQGIILEEKLRKEGEAVQFFNPADQGIRFVANSVVTSKQMMEAHPEVVRKFTAALMAGWSAAISPANEKTAIEVLQKYDRDTPHNIRVKQLMATRGLIRPVNGQTPGHIDLEAWRQTETIMLDQGLILRPVFVEKILKPGAMVHPKSP